MGITFFMIAPLVINIISYTLIIKKVSSERLKSINSVTILTRSILICTLFTLSWMPSVIIGDILQIKSFGWQIVGRWFFYLNCLTDPILYAFSSKPISACLNKFQVFKSSSSLSLSGSSLEIVSRIRRLSTLNRVHPSQQTCSTRTRFSVGSAVCLEEDVSRLRQPRMSLPTIYSD